MAHGLDLLWYALAFAGVGIVAGFVAGFFGIGGGIFTVPVFLFVFSRFGVANDVIMHEAVGTSLALVGPASLMATWKQWKMGRLNLSYLKTWWPPLLLGVVVGTVILAFANTFWLQLIFIAFLLAVSIYVGLARKSWVLTSAPPKGWKKGTLASSIGGLSVLVGSGGGVFVSPAMKACNCPFKESIALSSASAVVIGFAGAVGAIIAGIGMVGRPTFSLGYVDWLVFLIMLPTELVFAPIGASWESHMDRRKLRITYAIFLLALATYMILHMSHAL